MPLITFEILTRLAASSVGAITESTLFSSNSWLLELDSVFISMLAALAKFSLSKSRSSKLKLRFNSIGLRLQSTKEERLKCDWFLVNTWCDSLCHIERSKRVVVNLSGTIPAGRTVESSMSVLMREL